MNDVVLLTTRGVSTGPLVPVLIYHDEREWGQKGLLEDGSQPELRFVYKCQTDADADTADVLETCFEEFNNGQDSPVAEEYRDLGLRSLSTGDVVVIGEAGWRCDSFGWSRYNTVTIP